MTIICVRNGVMAADSAASAAMIRAGSARKIVRMPNGGLAAACGDSGRTAEFRAWAEAGMPQNKVPRGVAAPEDENSGFAATILGPDGSVWRLLAGNQWVPQDNPYHADGCAWQFALGAMAAGASAERAVRLAIKHCDGCGGPVQVERL